MNCLGYGPEIIKARRDIYKQHEMLYNAGLYEQYGATSIISGSKGEGLSFFLESDTDLVYILPDVMCLEDGIQHVNLSSETTVLRLHTRMSYPGHCRLLKERCGWILPALANSFCDDGYGRTIVSSDLFIHECKKKSRGIGVSKNRAGPSLPNVFFGILDRDMVYSLRCHCPSILQRWAERSRHWPSPSVVQNVVSMGACVTPVGFKESEYSHVEWRICFNTGEKELVFNLNDVQVKLYILLKMVKKDVLKPRNKEITSYTLKNIILWQAEKNLQSLFNERSLLHWLNKALCDLRTAINTQQLPYYMIPERNLMAASGLVSERQSEFVAKLTDMINEGPRVILRLQKLRKAIVAHPEPLLWYSRKRIELELVWLLSSLSYQLSKRPGATHVSDLIKLVTFQRLNEIVGKVDQRMIMEGSRVDDIHYDVWFRMLM
ncbi:hypothetical protein DPMN_038927 [Dreissena polymorpha]|uniref:Uncharacterized protein n=2 Tax=Dreissena polymorpha TaxID=45954 RepID=A0A9D4RP46_DREPO|nr:hypothetical protein DPMN_038927 [Dreissena polymorpha]